MHQRITSDLAILSGKPAIRSTQISVEMVVNYLAAGLSIDDIVHEHPTLERADVIACIDCVQQGYATPEVLRYAHH